MFREVEPEQFQRAGQVAFRFQLDDVRLLALDFKRLKDEKDEPAGSQQVIVADRATWELQNDGATLACSISFDVGTHPTNGSAEDGGVFQISARFGLTYLRMVEGKLPDADFSAFAALNAVHNVWPYLRELVHSLSSRAGFPPLVMEPLLMVPKAGKPADKKKALPESK